MTSVLKQACAELARESSDSAIISSQPAASSHNLSADFYELGTPTVSSKINIVFPQ